MKMKKLILFGVFLFSLNAGFGQKISKLEDFVDPDSMVIRVDKIQVGKENKELATELSYDFKHQYPYFILSKNITTGDTIKFYEWNENFPLIANKLNIYEPPAGIEMIPDALLIPVVGFDKDCNRLGHGYGHYDKGLSKIITSIKIGIGYSFQEVEHVPAEKHDIKMDYIITEKFCY